MNVLAVDTEDWQAYSWVIRSLKQLRNFMIFILFYFKTVWD